MVLKKILVLAIVSSYQGLKGRKGLGLLKAQRKDHVVDGVAFDYTSLLNLAPELMDSWSPC